jgi:hypothetical protein
MHGFASFFAPSNANDLFLADGLWAIGQATLEYIQPQAQIEPSHGPSVQKVPVTWDGAPRRLPAAGAVPGLAGIGRFARLAKPLFICIISTVYRKLRQAVEAFVRAAALF